MEKKVKTTRKSSLAIEKLNNMVTQMEYYYKGTDSWRGFVQDAIYIEEHLLELSSDKKVDHAKFAKRFKSMFFKENKELKEKNKELKEKVEELKNDIEVIESEKHE